MSRVYSEGISSDTALISVDEDELGVSPLAKRLASSLVSLRSDSGMVVSVSGDWGLGKSTFINYVCHYLQEDHKEDCPIIVRFNPWQLSGHEDLTRRFFLELSLKLKARAQELSKAGELTEAAAKKIADAAQAIADFADSFMELPGWVHGLTGGLSAGASILKLFKKREKPLEDERTKVEALLEATGKKILVVIDDLDRLETEDIRDMMRMVKSVANFPNVLYLLAFDNAIVSAALNNVQGLEDGKNYLEKIVQVDFTLPPPDQEKLNRMFFNKLDKLINETGGGKVDEHRWAQAFHFLVKPCLKTPRHVIRLCNALALTYPPMAGEVDISDFVGIETLRLFHVDAYDFMRNNLNLFSGSSANPGTHRDKENEHVEKVIDKLVPDENERKQFKDALGQLFPRLQKGGYAKEFWMNWKAESRVCIPEFASRYFSYSIPEGAFSNAEIQDIMKKISDSAEMESIMQTFLSNLDQDGRSRVPAFFDRLEGEIRKGNADDALESIIAVTIKMGDTLNRKEDEGKGFFDVLNNVWLLRFTVEAALERIDRARRFDILKAAFENSYSVGFLAYLARGFAREHGKYDEQETRPTNERLLSVGQVEELEGVALDKIRQAAQDNTLAESKSLPGILYGWKEFSGSWDEPKTWVEGVTQDDNGLLNIIVSLTGKGRQANLSSGVVQETVQVDLPFLSELFDLNTLQSRLERMKRTGFSNSEHERVVTAVLYEFQKRLNAREHDPLYDKPIDENTLKEYSKKIYPDLFIDDNLQRRLLSDIDLGKYPTIGALNDAYEQAKGFLEWYSEQKPDFFKKSTDYLTKTLGFVDRHFRKKHGFAQDTLTAFDAYAQQSDKDAA